VKKTLMMLLIATFVLGIAGTAMAFPVDFSGDVRYQFRGWDDGVGVADSGTYTDQLGRIRLNFSAQVDQDVTFYGRLASRTFFGQLDRAGDNTMLLDQYGVKMASNGWNFNVGRQAINIGQGTIMNTGADAGYDSKFDGLVASGKIGVVNSTFAVGKTTDGLLTQFVPYTRATSTAGVADQSGTAYTANWWSADFSVPVSSNLTFGASYATEKKNWNGLDTKLITATNTTGAFTASDAANKYLAFNATFNPSSNLTLNGEYVKSNADTNNKAYFLAGTYSWDKDWFCIQYNNVEGHAVDQAMSGIGNIMYPFNGANLGDLDGKYSGFTYVYNHQMSKAAALNICYMSLKEAGETGLDNEYAAGVQWNF